MDIRLSEAGHVRWRFAVCSIEHGRPRLCFHRRPIKPFITRESENAPLSRARAVSAYNAGHTQRTNERENALPATRRTGPVVDIMHTHTHVCTYTSTRVTSALHSRNFRQVSKGWRMIATGRKDDESGSIIFSTSHRWSTLPLVWSSANPATARLLEPNPGITLNA